MNHQQPAKNTGFAIVSANIAYECVTNYLRQNECVEIENYGCNPVSHLKIYIDYAFGWVFWYYNKHRVTEQFLFPGLIRRQDR